MLPRRSVALALSDTMLANDASLPGLIASAARALGAQPAWVAPVCEAIITRTGIHFRHFGRDELADIILGQVEFENAWESESGPPEILRYCLAAPIAPEAPAWVAEMDLPAIASVGELAAWFNLPPNDLAWYADQWRIEPGQSPRLNHYHYRWVAKRSGGERLIEIPKPQLRTMQQKILRQILDKVPAHPAAHGFRRGRSCLTHAALHAGKRVVIRMDLKDFFPSIPHSRVHAMFAKLGYSQSVAGSLARLCVNRTPSGVFDGRGLSWIERQPFRSPHLPQGSPCSPAVANACAFRLDVRLQALADAMGASYSRYADDLAFSGDASLERALDRFHVQVAAIANEEGFRINTRKTRMMPAGTRQQLTGIVVNRHPNNVRGEYDVLKAILTNCVRHGPEGQNREGRGNFRAWLGGRVAHMRMVNPGRGERLRKLYAQIMWPAATVVPLPRPRESGDPSFGPKPN